MRNAELARTLGDAWRYVFEELYCAEMDLLYDYRSSTDPGHRFDHLPTVEEVKAQTPNPCGWGTGMEDSMLNGGALLDVVVRRYEHTGKAELTVWAEGIVRGMERCATVHGRRGFLVRSLSPRDGTSFYGNTSRDQYTLAVYGLWRLYRSGLASDALKSRIRSLLVDFAEYCEKTVIGENEYNLLRFDGKPGLVCRMREGDIGIHEIMRLPMIYAAAWEVSGYPHWREKYLECALPGVAINLDFARKSWWWYMELYQMAVCMDLLRTIETDSPLRRKYEEILDKAAVLASGQLRDLAKDVQTNQPVFSAKPLVWRETVFTLRRYDPERPNASALFQGQPYYMPDLGKDFLRAQEILRSLGQLWFVLRIGGHETGETLQIFQDMLKQLDYGEHHSDAPIYLLQAFGFKTELSKLL